MRYLVLGVQELLESRRFFDLQLDFVLFFELVSRFSVASEAAAVEAVVAVEAAEQSRARLALADCEVVNGKFSVGYTRLIQSLPSKNLPSLFPLIFL